jgi:hypothetical protein
VSPPRFDELVDDDLPAEERERLRRAHDALIAAGAPAELSSALRHPPGTPAYQDEVRVLPRYYPPKWAAAAALMAAAAAAVSFGIGYLVGKPESDRVVAPQQRIERVVTLRGAEKPGAVAVVEIGREDDDGNRPMRVIVEGLPQLGGGDYYTLFMTKKGKPVVPCGTLNVQGDGKRTAVRLNSAYELEGFDGLALAEYNAEDHSDRVLMRASLA